MTLFWTALGVGWAVAFAPAEIYALFQDDPAGALTLSRFMYEIAAAWPPVVFMLGFTAGLLAEHFWRYLAVGFGRPNAPPIVRYPLLALGWIIVIVFTGGGPAVFLTGVAIGMPVTFFLWPWRPTDPMDRRG